MANGKKHLYEVSILTVWGIYDKLLIEACLFPWILQQSRGGVSGTTTKTKLIWGNPKWQEPVQNQNLPTSVYFATTGRVMPA